MDQKVDENLSFFVQSLGLLGNHRLVLVVAHQVVLSPNPHPKGGYIFLKPFLFRPVFYPKKCRGRCPWPPPLAILLLRGAGAALGPGAAGRAPGRAAGRRRAAGLGRRGAGAVLKGEADTNCLDFLEMSLNIDMDYKTITYLPHEAVAEVSKDMEPIGRECAEFSWFESQLMSDSNELRVK